MNAADVMRRRYPSYHRPYEIARAWLREGGPRRADALELLTALRDRYPHALAIGHELVLAAVARQRGEEERSVEYLRRAEEAADDVLARRAAWPHDLPDDDVWHPATAGEAYLLKKQWAAAAAQYTAALAAPGVQPFHRASVGNQARRILRAWELLDVHPDPFDPDALFGPAPG